jgi:class 3 adenylate cyclase/tetratricopeptide (TPR) repeat protein
MTQPTQSQNRQGRRRALLTILFTDLSSYTKITEQYEPEDADEIVEHFKRIARAEIERFDGTIVGWEGDGVMAMFGYPAPSEHDGRRAVSAALALHKAIRDNPIEATRFVAPKLTVHTGIHCEHVMLRENEPGPGQHAIVGHSAPVAKKLSDIGKANQIFVSMPTLGIDRHLFEIREYEPTLLEGKSEKIAFVEVLDELPPVSRYEARTRRGLTPLVDRTDEVAILEGHMQALRDKRGHEVAVVAAAGVGKTRLIEHLLSRTAGPDVRVCRGYCENYLDAEPLQPFLQILRAIAGDVSGAPATISALIRTLGDRFPSVARRAITPQEIEQWICDLLVVLSNQTPIVIFLDDWQWADDASKHVVARLREVTDRRILLILAVRDGPANAGGLPHENRIDLKPLSRAHAAQFIASLRKTADPFVVERIQQFSGGNPLFLEELCHPESSLDESRGDEPGHTVPAWLRRLIESRVAGLPARQSEIVRTAAVIGVTVPGWLLTSMTGVNTADPVFEELAEADLIHAMGDAGQNLRFKHGMTREAVYQSINKNDRRTLHHKIGKMLERVGAGEPDQRPLEALSYHFREAADHELAARYAEAAGFKAAHGGAPDRARDQFETALRSLDALGTLDAHYNRRRNIIYHLGLACVFDPSRDHLEHFLIAGEQARQRDDSIGLATAEYWAAFIRYAIGELDEAMTHFERARVHCEAAIERLARAGAREDAPKMESFRVQILTALGEAHGAAGEHDKALALLDEGLEIKRRYRRRATHAVGSAYALACKGTVLGDLGRFTEADACFDEAFDIVDTGHAPIKASVSGWRSAVYLWQGEWKLARDTAANAWHLAERFGSLYVLAMCKGVEAYASWMLDQSPTALEDIARAVEWLEMREKRLSISLAYGWMADINATQLSADAARACAEKAIARAKQRDCFGLPMSYRALARLPWLGAGPTPDDYLALAVKASAARSPREVAITKFHRGVQAMDEGRRDEGCAIVDEARAAFAAMQMASFVRAADRRRGGGGVGYRAAPAADANPYRERRRTGR